MLAATIRELAPTEQQQAVLRSKAFDIAREQLLTPHAADALHWLEDVVKTISAVTSDEAAQPASEVFFTPADNCPGKIGAMLNNARRSVDICVFTITDDRVSDAIVAAHQRNVLVRIITDSDKAWDAGSDVHRFTRLGVPVRMDHSEYHMHHKFAVFDDSVTLTGSYNWTRGAAQYNSENFLVTHDHHLTVRYRREFDRLWETLQ